MPGVHPDFALGVTFKLPLTSAEFSRCIQVTSWGAALNLANPLWVQCCCGLAWPGPPPTSHSLPLVHTRPPSPLHTLCPWSTPGPSHFTLSAPGPHQTPLPTSHSLSLVHAWASCRPKPEAFFDPQSRWGPFGPYLLFSSCLWDSPTSYRNPHGHGPLCLIYAVLGT